MECHSSAHGLASSHPGARSRNSRLGCHFRDCLHCGPFLGIAGDATSLVHQAAAAADHFGHDRPSVDRLHHHACIIWPSLSRRFSIEQAGPRSLEHSLCHIPIQQHVPAIWEALQEKLSWMVCVHGWLSSTCRPLHHFGLSPYCR